MSGPKGSLTNESYARSVASFTVKGKEATHRGEQKAKETGTMDPKVDPKGMKAYGSVRLSNMRFNELPDGKFEVAMGAPVSVEFNVDTTGSMGGNVNIALRVLQNLCALISIALTGRDPFYCAGIFGDVTDKYPYCRGQFEVLAERFVEQLSLMVPCRDGSDPDEDPHYGFFAGAYLTDAYLQRIGLKTMHFTITDARMHDSLSSVQLERIFGKEVYAQARENGHEIDPKNLPSNKKVIEDLHKRSHAFMLLVDASGGDSYLYNYWVKLFGKEHVIVMRKTEDLAHVMAAVTALTEGADLQSCKEFLMATNLDEGRAQQIVDSVAHIPLGAQCALPNYSRLPKKGDIFASKTDLFSIATAEEYAAANPEANFEEDGDTEAQAATAGDSKADGWL